MPKKKVTKKAAKRTERRVVESEAEVTRPTATGPEVAATIAAVSGDHRLQVPVTEGAFDVSVAMTGTNPLWSLTLLDPENNESHLLGENKPHLDTTVGGLEARTYLLISQVVFSEDQGSFALSCGSETDQEAVTFNPAGGSVQTDVLPVVVE